MASAALYVLTDDPWLVDQNMYPLFGPDQPSSNITPITFSGVQGVTLTLTRPSMLAIFVVGAVFSANCECFSSSPSSVCMN